MTIAHCYKVNINEIHRIRGGGASVLKVGGGKILRVERAKNFFDPLLCGEFGDKILFR